MSKKMKTKHTPQSTQDQPQAPKISWIELATEIEPLSAIPVLPRRFQADLPNWTGNCQDPESLKWLGERIWSFQESEESCDDSSQDNNNEVTGEGKPGICTCQSPGSGRLEICSCHSPGSAECNSRHVTEERNRLKTELGPAFEEWKLDQMGEKACSGWSPREEKKFEALVKRNLSEENQSHVESSWKSFRNKDRKTLVSYYFNVYIPRKVSRETRSGCTEVETDDDVPSNSQKRKSEELESNNNSQKTSTKSETAEDGRMKSKSSESQKKSANYARKNKYLAGRR